jgi:hypothetical protein
MTKQKLPPQPQVQSLAKIMTHARGFEAIHEAAQATIPLHQFAKMTRNRKSLEASLQDLVQAETLDALGTVALQESVHELAPFAPEFERDLDGRDLTAVTRLALSAQILHFANVLDKYQYSLAATNQERWNSLSRAIVSIHQAGLWPLVDPSDDGSHAEP